MTTSPTVIVVAGANGNLGKLDYGSHEDLMRVRAGAHCVSALGVMSPARLDNDRYKGIQWTGVDDVVRRASREAETSK
jgi:hypothetical protein